MVPKSFTYTFLRASNCEGSRQTAIVSAGDMSRSNPIAGVNQSSSLLADDEQIPDWQAIEVEVPRGWGR